MRTTIFIIAFTVTILCPDCIAKANPATLVTQPADDEVESIIREFESGDNITYINLPKTLIKLRSEAANSGIANVLVEQIDGLQILTFEKASQEIRDGLYNCISKLETRGYEPMIRINKDGGEVRIFIEDNEKGVRSPVVFVMDKEDCSLVNTVGRINPSSIDDVAKSQTK